MLAKRKSAAVRQGSKEACSKVDRPWRRWKRGKKRFAELTKRGINKNLSTQTAGCVRDPWRISRSPALSFAFPNAHFNTLGLALLAEQRTA